MRTNLGITDRFFGKKLLLTIPTEAGTERRTVTRAWLEEMQRAGKLHKSLGKRVTAHIIDHLEIGKLSIFWLNPAMRRSFVAHVGEDSIKKTMRRACYQETRTVGDDVPLDDYEKLGGGTDSMFAYVVYDGDKKSGLRFVAQADWIADKKTWEERIGRFPE